MPYTGITSLAGKQVCFWPVKRATWKDYEKSCEKGRTTHYFLQQRFSQPATTLFAAWQIWFRGCETRKIAIQVILQQCFQNKLHVFVASRKDYKEKKLLCLRS